MEKSWNFILYFPWEPCHMDYGVCNCDETWDQLAHLRISLQIKLKFHAYKKFLCWHFNIYEQDKF